MNSIPKEKRQTLTLRIPKSLHADVVKRAGKEGVSINTYCLYVLASSPEKKERE